MHDHLNAIAIPTSRTGSTLVRKGRRIVRPVPRRDLQIGSMPRTNVLVLGSPDATRIVIDMLRLDLRGPVVQSPAGQPLELPEPGRAATLVIEHLTRLDADEQLRLLHWLEEVNGRTHVVSTTPVALWPRVQRGEFNEVLYYRLNTVFVDMGTA